MVRLFLNNYEDTDGRQRLESALSLIQEDYKENYNDILEKLSQLGAYLNIEGKEKLCISIIKYFPYELERLAELFGLLYLVGDSISEKVKKFKKLNKKLYGELEQIGTL